MRLLVEASLLAKRPKAGLTTRYRNPLFAVGAHGAEVAASAVERGATKAASAVGHGVSSAASAVERGASATGRAIEKAADKVGLPASGASSSRR